MLPETTLRSLCQELLKKCLTALASDPEGPGSEDVVHNLRVATKRLRAAWKMVRPLVGKDFVKERAAALRELSALLACARDHAVLVGLGRKLDKAYPEAPFHEVVDFLENAPQSGESTEANESRIRELVADEHKAWDSVTFESPAAEQTALRRAVVESRSKARAATRLALADKHAGVWHNWRKAVKQLRYQREFLAEIQSRLPGKWDARISRLGSRLGDRNDLANLTAIVESMGNDPQLRKTIAEEERSILGNCRRLGRRNLA